MLRNRVDIYRKTDINPVGLNPPNITWKNRPAGTGKTGCGDYAACLNDVDFFERHRPGSSHRSTLAANAITMTAAHAMATNAAAYAIIPAVDGNGRRT